MTISLPDEGAVSPIDKTAWVMDSIMNAIIEVFDFYDIELPALKYLTVGEPVHDCEQVTVTILQGYLGSPGLQSEDPQPCNGPRSGVFQVEIVRCVDDGSVTNLRQRSGGTTAPDPEKISEYTRSRTRDLWALLEVPQHLNDYNQAIADAGITEMRGKYQAVVLNLVVQI